MGRLTDLIGERLGAEPTTLPALRATGVQTPNSKLRAGSSISEQLEKRGSLLN